MKNKYYLYKKFELDLLEALKKVRPQDIQIILNPIKDNKEAFLLYHTEGQLDNNYNGNGIIPVITHATKSYPIDIIQEVIKDNKVSILTEKDKGVLEKFTDRASKALYNIVNDIAGDGGLSNREKIRDEFNNRDDSSLYSNKLPKTYTVKRGDSLWKIAKENNMSIDELIRLNPDKKDMIHPNDVLLLEPYIETKKVNVREEWINESDWNKSNISAILGYKHNLNYVIIDKLNRTVTVYDKNNKPLYTTSDFSTGLSGMDFNTITYRGESGNGIKNYAGNNSTPAGITVISGKSTYHGYPSFTRARIDEYGHVNKVPEKKKVNGKFTNTGNMIDDNIASSIHYGLIGSDRLASNGCIRMGGLALIDLNKLLTVGSRVYVLPEQPGSRFTINGGLLSFTADNAYGNEDKNNPRRNWDNYNVYNSKIYYPIKITYNGTPSVKKLHTVQTFIKTLEDSKKTILKLFNLTSNEYNRLALAALGIAEQESSFGKHPKYVSKELLKDPDKRVLKWGKKQYDRLKNNGIELYAISIGQDVMNGTFFDVGELSRGMTLVKLEGDNEELSKLYLQFDIDKNTINNTDKAALATILRLGYIYSNEVKGGNFKDANGNNLDPMYTTLYRYMGSPLQVTNGTSTPDQNKYIQNVMNYASDFNIIESRQNEVIPQHRLGSRLIKKFDGGGNMSNTTSLEGKVVSTGERVGDLNNLTDMVSYYPTDDPNDRVRMSKAQFILYAKDNNLDLNKLGYVNIVDPINNVTPKELDEVVVIGKKPTLTTPEAPTKVTKRPFDKLIERRIAANAPYNEYALRIYNQIGWNPIFNKIKLENVLKLWKDNPKYAKAMMEAGNEAGLAVAAVAAPWAISEAAPLLGYLAPGTVGGNIIGQTAGYTAADMLLNTGYQALTGSNLHYMDDALDYLGIRNPYVRTVGYMANPLNFLNYGKWGNLVYNWAGKLGSRAYNYGNRVYNQIGNTVTNGRDLVLAFKNRDFHNVLNNPITVKVAKSPITELFFTKTPQGKRVLEIGMRSGGDGGNPNPSLKIIAELQNGPIRPKIDYILLGKSPLARKIFGRPMMHYGDNFFRGTPYTGVYSYLQKPLTIRKGYGDVVDTYLYGKELDPKIAVRTTDTDGLEYFKGYIENNYSGKNIPTYKVVKPTEVDDAVVTDKGQWKGIEYGDDFVTDHGVINVGGYNGLSGTTASGDQVTRGYDIWKFNPKEYINRWSSPEELDHNPLFPIFLDYVNKAGTPIIFKSPWHF